MMVFTSYKTCLRGTVCGGMDVMSVGGRMATV